MVNAAGGVNEWSVLNAGPESLQPSQLIYRRRGWPLDKDLRWQTRNTRDGDVADHVAALH